METLQGRVSVLHFHAEVKGNIFSALLFNESFAHIMKSADGEPFKAE